MLQGLYLRGQLYLGDSGAIHLKTTSTWHVCFQKTASCETKKILVALYNILEASHFNLLPPFIERFGLKQTREFQGQCHISPDRDFVYNFWTWCLTLMEWYFSSWHNIIIGWKQLSSGLENHLNFFVDNFLRSVELSCSRRRNLGWVLFFRISGENLSLGCNNHTELIKLFAYDYLKIGF